MRVDIVLTILAMSAATYFTRITSPALLGATGIPKWLEKMLKHVPTAMLTALIAPALVAPKGFLDLSLSNYYLLAGLVAGFLAYRNHPPAITMGIGMAVMLGLRSFGQ